MQGSKHCWKKHCQMYHMQKITDNGKLSNMLKISRIENGLVFAARHMFAADSSRIFQIPSESVKSRFRRQ